MTFIVPKGRKIKLNELQLRKNDSRNQISGKGKKIIFTGRGDYSRIRARSLIRNKKPIVLFERHCHATEKLEVIACARRCRSSQLTG
jgi:hypothetical protein